MKFDLNSFLISLSTALDLSEEDLFGINLHHSKRVSYISLRIAKEIKFTKKECFDITALALLHDNGITESCQKVNFSKELVKLESIYEHCEIGEYNIKDFPFFSGVKNVIKYHHENFDGSGFFGKSFNEIPIMSQIISFADKLDVVFNLENDSLSNRQKIKQYVIENSNKLHSDKISQIFFKLYEQRSFWLDLKSMAITSSLKEHIPKIKIITSLDEIYEITKVFTRIIDSKSKFTSKHSSGLIELADKMSDFYKFDYDKKIKFKIAASLHDVGKLAIPNYILDKSSALETEEYDKIKTHTYYTYYILKSISGFEEISHWASRHHERLDGSGYPFGLEKSNLSFESRLMSCLDVYQALREDRPYREGMEHNKIMNILNEMGNKNYIDTSIVRDIHYNLS